MEKNTDITQTKEFKEEVSKLFDMASPQDWEEATREAVEVILSSKFDGECVTDAARTVLDLNKFFCRLAIAELKLEAG